MVYEIWAMQIVFLFAEKSVLNVFLVAVLVQSAWEDRRFEGRVPPL